MCNLFAPMAAEFGWFDRDSDSDLDKVKRTLVVNQAGKYGDQAVVDQAKELFKTGAKVSSDLKYALYKLVVQHGGVDEYEKVLDIYRTADMHSEKLQALRALGATQDEALLLRTMEMGMSNEVRSQDTFYVYAYVAANLKGRAIAWQYLQDHYDAFLTKFSGTGFLLGRIIGDVVSHFSDLGKADEVEKFFATHDAPGAERTIQQALESIRSKAAWLARDATDVKEFLDSL
mmetsp:Transcript_17633/g.68459  ORF Transcript_17633/g.68459 Transcript_17633/m.68459 type:complete len:231 (+) Transcript_17633:333-1025(+)